jgi:LytS/YehU family sensor histidine kinase
MIIEYDKEKDELEKNYKDMLDKLENKNTLNNKFLEQKVKIKINVPDDEKDYPSQIPPYILEILTENAVK